LFYLFFCSARHLSQTTCKLSANLDHTEMKELEAFIFKFVEPTEEELSQFLQYVKTENFPKGKKIIKAGAVSDKIFFVKKGLLKYLFVLGENKEKAIDIAMENDLVADYFSFFSGYPSISSVETITPCELLFIAKKDLAILYERYKIWERFGRLVAEMAVLDQIMEKLKFQTKSPEQRYTELIAKKPTLLQDVKQNQRSHLIF
jgi:CRP-like cAMP-binding protein